MKSTSRLFVTLAIHLLIAIQTPDVLVAAEWSVPLAGNAFRSAPGPSNDGFHRDGNVAWDDAEGVFSIFFRIDRPAELSLAIHARVPDRRSTLVTRVGSKTLTTTIQGTKQSLHELGRIEVPQAGYVRVDLQGSQRDGAVFAEIHDLVVASETDSLALDFVRTNEGNMFYWGRRGPSVHLRYEVPRESKLQYAYSEITVPEGQDTIGSYFMANGFAEGYFGIQVNGPEERRVLFSVWSPFKTDNPRDIPEDQRIVTLGSGPDVRVGEFGNEGSGGQSYLVYPWKAGTTYRFLTEVKPIGNGETVYTSWFGDKTTDNAAGATTDNSTAPWRLIASFRRPRTETHLRGFHSFLENFVPSTGHLGRRALYGNVWVRDVDGQWHQCTEARFSVDATGGGRHRLDFTGGAEGGAFFLRNCGFFDETGQPGQVYTRGSTAEQRPEIDFDLLPRS